MFAFITILISYIITLSILFGTKEQVKRRKRTDHWWSNYAWEDIDKRPKWMVGILLLSFILCIIPVLNIIWSILFLIWYFKQLEGPCYYNGDELEATRIVYSNKFTKWLTKEV